MEQDLLHPQTSSHANQGSVFLVGPGAFGLSVFRVFTD